MYAKCNTGVEDSQKHAEVIEPSSNEFESTLQENGVLVKYYQA